LEEWLSAAEYIALAGNKSIVLCERGVKSAVRGDYNRSQIDLDVIPAVKNRTILPIIVDPSHSSGSDELVPYQFAAASVYGANGAIVEVIADDTDRKTVRCDARQAVRLKDFERMVKYRLALEKIEVCLDESNPKDTG
jgi:3-deoxy-7-phosphoheptulonate synthase